MKFCNMAVVVPVDQLTGSKAALSAQVWGRASNLLMPALGKLYRQFHPANDAWGHKLTSPFSVVLGCQEPELFLTLFLTGQQTQQEAVAFHAAAMIKKVDMDKAQKAGDSLICPVVVDGSDPELMIHALWHISLQKGAPLPDCGIYYAALGRAVASQEEQRAILSNPAGYREIDPLELYYVINQSYASNDYLDSGFLPEHCLHLSMSATEKYFVLWNPELRADVIYGDREYPNFPIPRMVFGVRVLENGKVAECSMGVVADEAPTVDTPMFFYPFSNVHSDDRVCTGNNVLPRYRKISALRNFPRYLLGLPDNDDMYDREHNRLKLSHGELLEHLKDKDPAYYYTDILVSNGKTLGDFISRR